ncbi:MAG: hypothetical protein ACLT4Y_10330 [Bifidobacterium breve]
MSLRHALAPMAQFRQDGGHGIEYADMQVIGGLHILRRAGTFPEAIGDVFAGTSAILFLSD